MKTIVALGILCLIGVALYDRHSIKESGIYDTPLPTADDIDPRKGKKYIVKSPKFDMFKKPTPVADASQEKKHHRTNKHPLQWPYNTKCHNRWVSISSHKARHPLHHAVMDGDIKMVKHLLSKGYDPNEPDTAYGKTPISYASEGTNPIDDRLGLRSWHWDLIGVLVEAGASPDVGAIDCRGVVMYGPLKVAIIEGCGICASQLLEMGANPRVLIPEGKKMIDYISKAKSNARAAELTFKTFRRLFYEETVGWSQGDVFKNKWRSEVRPHQMKWDRAQSIYKTMQDAGGANHHPSLKVWNVKVPPHKYNKDDVALSPSGILAMFVISIFAIICFLEFRARPACDIG